VLTVFGRPTFGGTRSRPARSAGLNRILLLSASAGAGHMRAAEAVEKELKSRGAARTIEHLDILTVSTGLMRDLYAKTYLKLAGAAPDLFGWIYNKSDRPWMYQKRKVAFDLMNLRVLMRKLETEQPELVICTHFTPAEIVSYLRKKHRLKTRLAVVVTDIDAHAMWLIQGVDMFCVALEETREYLARVGVARNRIAVTGIPIDPVFAIRKNKLAMRRKHGLHPTRPGILISAGGFGVGPVEAVLTGLAGMSRPAQVIAICGRNEALRKKLESKYGRKKGKISFKIVGFTQHMDELMSASDLMVGKPGGLTMSESLAKGLAMVIVNPIPGQEERNADHLLEAGAAIRCNNPPVLAWKIDRLLAAPRRLAAMQAAARSLARPDSAARVAAAVL